MCFYYLLCYRPPFISFIYQRIWYCASSHLKLTFGKQIHLKSNFLLELSLVLCCSIVHYWWTQWWYLFIFLKSFLKIHYWSDLKNIWKKNSFLYFQMKSDLVRRRLEILIIICTNIGKVSQHSPSQLFSSNEISKAQ